jgi:hypothetical protein
VDVVDGVKPEISHVRVIEAPVFGEIRIWAGVADAIQLQNVTLHYRTIDSAAFVHAAMLLNTTANAFEAKIPAQTTTGQVQYNITAVDASGNLNSTLTYAIQIIDRTAPLINSVIPEYLENQTLVLVRANVTDDVEVGEVVLYFKAVGGNQWVPRTMANTGGDYYEFTIPAQSRTGVIYYYVNATDNFGNQASTLAEQDQFQIEVVGVGSDYTIYYVLGGVLVALLVVLGYLVVRKFTRPEQDAGPDEEKADDEP